MAVKRHLGKIGDPQDKGPTRRTQPLYRGSPKHKNRPAEGAKGTICPEWTHESAVGGLGNDMFAHDWVSTRAASLFGAAMVDSSSNRRFATERGIAFEAKRTADGTWHGFPVPWEAVPSEIKDRWLDDGAVTKRQTRAFYRFDRNEIHWALSTDDP